MKKMKKILAFVMAMAMVLGMSLTSFASEGSTIPNPNPTTSKEPALGTSADKGTIAISGVAANDDESVSTISVTAYQIIKAKYENNKPAGGGDDSGKFSGYEDVYPAAGVDFVDEKGELIESSITEANLAAIRAYIENQNVVGTEMNATNTSGEYKAENVSVGTYLVVISGAEGMIYSNIVVSVQYVNEDGSSEQVESANLYIHNGMTFAKVQENPTITKEIENVSDATEGQKDDDKVVANTANVGDVLQFKITAPILHYSGNYPVFKVTDTLTGLKYKYDISEGNNYRMSVNAVDGTGKKTPITGYTIEKGDASLSEEALANETQIVLNFVTNNGYILKEYAGQTLEITYYATIDASAAQYNSNPNKNTVKLEYTHNSNVSGDGEKDETPEDETKTYTFDLSGEMNGSTTESMITKKDGSTMETTKKALGGAEFMLYQKDLNGAIIPYINAVMNDRVAVSSDQNAAMTTKVVSSADNSNKGAIIIRGLAAGTYYLKETKAPDGYSLSDHEYVIVVAPTFENEELKECKITVDGQDLFTITKTNVTNKVEANGVILNTKLSSLPSTGGIGTTIFTIGGCAIMIVAAGLYFASRRKSSK